jgi:molecular chaperone GrpE
MKDKENKKSIQDNEIKSDTDDSNQNMSSTDENCEDADSQQDNAVEELQTKVNELNDKYLRLFSEFDNFRKRSVKERMEYSKMASADMITALLPIFDDLGRACEIAKSSSDKDSFADGVNLIYSKFKSILNQKGVEEIPSVGELFNTDFHEAISNVPTESEKEKGRIIEEVEKGYILHGKVLRFAKVVVAN